MKLLVVLSLLAACAFARKTFHGDQVLRIHPKTQEQIQFLQSWEQSNELDFWKAIRSIGVAVDVRVPANHLASFKLELTRCGLVYEIFVDDVQTLIDAQRVDRPAAKDLASFDYNVYHTFDEIQQWIDDMALEHTNLATKSFVGTSYEGRGFGALTISARTGNPQFVINCGIHAREWITPATCMYSAKMLVDGYGSDSLITQLLDQVDFVFIPSSNPDGYAYTWSNDRMWRKTRSRGNGVCVGVDPNRNWAVGFGGSGASSSPCSETYHGPAAFSEPCTAAQRDFVEALPNVKMYIDVHAYSQLWMYSFGYTTSRPANYNTLDGIARDSAQAIFNTHGKFYEPGQISTTIYVASGVTTDYFYNTVTQCSFTSELRDTGRYGFLLPENQIQPTAEESFAAFKVMAQAIIDGQCEA